MQVSLKHNHYTVKNGVLVAKPESSERPVNYRYVPYNPVNRPTEQDYFRVTIDKLLQQNKDLKGLLSDRDRQNEKLRAGASQSMIVERLQQELRELRMKHAASECELRKHKGILVTKDKKMEEIRNQNLRLERIIDELSGQFQQLKRKLEISESESVKINRVLESFSSTVGKIMELEKYLEQSSPLPASYHKYSTHNQQTSISEEDDEDDADERFMTPKQKIHELHPSSNYKNRSAEQQNVAYYNKYPETKTKGALHSTQSQSKIRSDVSNYQATIYRVNTEQQSDSKFLKRGDESTVARRYLGFAQ